MKTSIRVHSALYCDIGPNAGTYRVDVLGSVFLSPEEYERYVDAQKTTKSGMGLTVILLDDDNTHDEKTH